MFDPTDPLNNDSCIPDESTADPLFLQNPIQLRFEKLSPWQLSAFSLMLCERFYPNYALFCEHTESQYNPQNYKQLLDLLWEWMTIKNCKINFENQLEKLEPLIPILDEDDLYITSYAVDACQALSYMIHSVLDKDELLDYTIKISQLAVQNVVQLYYDQLPDVDIENSTPITNSNQKQFEPVCDEWDAQWEIYRLLKTQEERDVDFLKDLQAELRSPWVSHLGIELTSSLA